MIVITTQNNDVFLPCFGWKFILEELLPHLTESGEDTGLKTF